MRSWSSRATRAIASTLLLVSSAARSSAGDVATAVPHVLWLGAPRGPASAREVDASGTRSTLSLPEPERARVAWQRRLASGASGNVLVDAAGSIFVPGLRRVAELGSDGSIRYQLDAPFSATVAAALLADGTRAVLTREGRVLGWSERGALVFQAELDVPAPSGASALLPLPDAALLVAVGRWLFAFDASRDLPLHAALPSAIALVRQVGGRTLVVDDRGHTFEWQRGAEPRPVGELSAPAIAALGDGEILVALTNARTLESLDPASGRTRELARFEAPGPLPLLALSATGRWVTLGAQGDWSILGANMPSPAPGARLRRDPAGGIREAELLVDGRGVVAHWAANRPLSLGGEGGTERELTEVRCSDPVALAPAGTGRLVAACSSGALWLIDSGAEH